MGHQFALEELLDATILREVAQSFEQLFGVALRLYSTSGALLADAQDVPRFYSFLDQTAEGRKVVHGTIRAVRSTAARLGAAVYVDCPSGGKYLITGLAYDGRLVGRTILGPFVDAELDKPPEATWNIIPEAVQSEALEAWGKLPRFDQTKVQKLDAHIKATLDLLIFSGLKAHLASSMHMASVQESYRELSEKNKKLQIAYDRLKELDRLKSNFLATVSHELRTPLTSIIGYSEMMLEGISGEINEEQREFLNTIYEKGEQLLELIKSLLDLSKLESGTMVLRRAPVNCAQLAEQVVKTLTPAAIKREVQLTVQAEDNLPILQADADRLRQVLNNLTENALKFTTKGGSVTVSTRQVRLATEDFGGVGGAVLGASQRLAIEFRVADSGIGIAENERDRVFDAFYQVDSSSTREVGGTGLGLSIVKRLVDAHDGTVKVEANQPCGATFVVTIPIFNRPT